jgi:hypothetical protein
MKRTTMHRAGLVAALVVAGAIACGSFGAPSAKACDLFSDCTVTVHVTGAGQANSSNAKTNHFCVSADTTPTGQEGATCTYTFGWGWVVNMNAAWPGWDGWSFKQWSGGGYANPVHCDGEDGGTNTYSGTYCSFWIWGNLDVRAEFVDTQAPDTTVTGPYGYFQRSTSATFTFTSSDHVPSTFSCSLDDAPYSACSSPATYSGLAQGAHILRVRAVDPSGNADPSPALAQWSVDTGAPQNPTLSSPSHRVGVWSNDATVDVTFAGAQDGWSGVDGYSYVWDQNPGTVPDTTKDAEETAPGTTSPALTDGYWYFHLRTVDNAGNWSAPTAIGPFQIDRTAPSGVAVTGNPAFPKSTKIPVDWTATDGGAGSGVAAYDVRYRAAPAGGSFGDYVGWQARMVATSATLTAVPGTTYCLSARAWDTAGNVSGWSAERCSTVPLDDGALAATGSWTRAGGAGSGYYLNTVSRSVAAGATLASPSVTAKRIGLLVTKCAGCGSVDVLWNGSLLATVNLAGTATEKKQLVKLPALAGVQSGVVTIRVKSSGQTVEIDGVAVSQL